jgi:tRNA(Ile)-lysidine synthase
VLRFGLRPPWPLPVKKRDRPISKRGARGSSLAVDILLAIQQGVYHRPLFRAGDRVGVAVSGGADSVALLRLLLELRDQLGIVVCVVHLNHQLRGRAADGDEKFVAKLAKSHELEYFVERADVAARAKREKLNVEDAARRARYEFFASLVKHGKIARVATAHTADDQAETVLAHVLRGAGLAGISGIHPVSGDVVRPLLGIRRAALRVYLREKKQTWREDTTNRDTTKMRARIRKTLIPLLEKQFQPATVKHLAALAQFARGDDEFLETVAETRCAIATKPNPDGLAIPCSEFQGPPSICRRMVRRIVKVVKPRAGELGARQVEAVLDLAEVGENGKSLQLPGGVEVRRDNEKLIFCAAESPRIVSRSSQKRGNSAVKTFEQPIDFVAGKATVAVSCLARSFRFTKIDWSRQTEETSTKRSVLNHDALLQPLVLRNWRPGDTFQPLGHRKPHKLKRLLNEKRISRWERDGWPVLTSAGVIAWVRGFPVGAAFAATTATESGVQIEEYASSSH